MKNIFKSKYFIIPMVVLLKIAMVTMLASTPMDFKKKKPKKQRNYYCTHSIYKQTR